MSHLIILPVVLPAILAPYLVLVLRHHIGLQRIFSIAGTVALSGIALALLIKASAGDVEVYDLGNWPAPFGIVLVLDRLSALMVFLTSLLSVAVVSYAVGSGWDKRGQHFHPLFQFQLMGISGAFLTGDAFNLFVFFEVLLIASYGLMIHGGGAKRFRVGVQYVAYNLLGSTLFLFALGTLYAVTGTLNMADLSVRVAELPVDEASLIRVGGVLLILVFSIKAAVLPLHFWLPATYSNAPLPVAALFAIMTKVGAYAIIRMHTLVFGPDVAVMSGAIETWLFPAALLTLIVGSVGVLGSREIGRLVAFAAITSVGTLLVSITQFTPEATAAALYYIVHSTLATGLMFLIADMVMERRGGAIAPSAPMPQAGLVSSLFFAGAIAMAGMPPLSGFIGKLMIMDASRDNPQVWTIWAVILINSFIVIVGFARAGSIIFWKGRDPSLGLTPPPEEQPDPFAEPQFPRPAPMPLTFVAAFGLLAALAALTIFANPMFEFAIETAKQLYNPVDYIETVLRRAGT